MSVEDSVDTDRNGIRAVCDEAVYRCFASISVSNRPSSVTRCFKLSFSAFNSLMAWMVSSGSLL